VLGERKFGGNAQSITKQRWVHHTSFLWDYQPERMQCLQHPPRTPEYRRVRMRGQSAPALLLTGNAAQGRAHSDFICRLRDRWPRRAMLGERVAAQLHEAGYRVQETSLEQAEQAVSRPHHSGSSLLDIRSGEEASAASMG